MEVAGKRLEVGGTPRWHSERHKWLFAVMGIVAKPVLSLAEGESGEAWGGGSDGLRWAPEVGGWSFR